MASLAVDKIKKKVTLSLSDHSQMSGHIFLSPISELGVGRETILDALTGVDRFIPFESGEGEFTFLNQKHIVWVASRGEAVEPDGAPLLEHRNVAVYLQGGKRLRGDLVLAVPEEKKRLSDALNELAGFMVIQDGEREILVNMDYVIRVTG